MNGLMALEYDEPEEESTYATPAFVRQVRRPFGSGKTAVDGDAAERRRRVRKEEARIESLEEEDSRSELPSDADP